MIFSIIKSALLAILVMLPVASWAQVTHVEMTEYADIAKVIQEKDNKYSPEEVLLIFDIDNTLLTAGTSVGSDIWYQWQTGKLDIKPTVSQKVPCLYDNAIGMLYELGPMQLTEPQLTNLIGKWQERHTVFALTSRAPNTQYATLRELNRYDIDFSKSAIKPNGAESAPDERGRLKRSWLYSKGVFWSSGQDKGIITDFILDKMGKKYKAIVFVDDGIANIDAMERMLSSKKWSSVDSTVIHYTRVERSLVKQQGKVLTEQQAIKMAKDWNELSKTLKEIFPDRSVICPAE